MPSFRNARARRLLLPLLLPLLLLLAPLCCWACAPAPAPPRPPPAHARSSSDPAAAPPAWQSTLGRDHPLVGKIWDVRARRFVAPEEVFDRLGAAQFVILGEKHDNPDHHALQARALREIVRRGKRPAVAFEMLDEDQQRAIDAFLSQPGANASGFGAAAAWEKRGWPKYAWYEPIVAAAIEARSHILAANLPLDSVRAIVKNPASLSETSAHALGVDKPLPPALAADLKNELRATHCGHLPETMLEPMALAQRARDGEMAARMQAMGGDAVLIAGAGHARTDRGVPWYLPAGSRTVSVAFTEVEDGVLAPEPAPYDYVWYTPRATDEDPCA